MPSSKLGHGHVAAISPHTHRLALRLALGNLSALPSAVLRCRVIQVSHRLDRPVNGREQIIQVIGADRQEVKMLQEQLDHERRRRNLDSCADVFTLTINSAPVIQLRETLSGGAGCSIRFTSASMES
jgi:hypothetical protein